MYKPAFMPHPSDAFKRRCLSMTPLIDVIFLLLLFFMLSSTFSKFVELELPSPATSGIAPKMVQSSPIFLKLSADQLSINGAAVEKSDLIRQISAVQSESRSPYVIFSIGRDVTTQQFVDTLTDLKFLSNLSIVIIR